MRRCRWIPQVHLPLSLTVVSPHTHTRVNSTGMWAFPPPSWGEKSKSLVFFPSKLLEILWLYTPTITSTFYFFVSPMSEKKNEWKRLRYITCNLFIWEVLHVYHKRDLFCRGNRACASSACTSRDTGRLSAVYNLTPECVTWRFPPLVLGVHHRMCPHPLVLYSLDLFLFCDMPRQVGGTISFELMILLCGWCR